MDDDLCPWCRGDVTAHCKTGHPTCKWVKCPDCGRTIDPQARLGYRIEKSGTCEVVRFPHASPDE